MNCLHISVTPSFPSSLDLSLFCTPTLSRQSDDSLNVLGHDVGERPELHWQCYITRPLSLVPRVEKG